MLTTELRSWYGAWMAECGGYKASTLAYRMQAVKVFLAYLVESGIGEPTGVDLAVMEGFARYLKGTVSKRTGKPYKPLAVRSLWHTAIGLLKALYEAGKITSLPIPKRILQQRVNSLMTLLSADEVSNFLDSIALDSDQGRRDRAMFELIYSSGLRASEVTRLKVGDLDLTQRLARIRQSKFDRDRIVPLTNEAVETLLCWLAHKPGPEAFVFPSPGGGLSSAAINIRFKFLLGRVGMYKPGLTTHQLRHACATHLIEGGAEIRYVQELLGHESIETTVRYTKNQVAHLKRAYRSHHPRENQLFEEVGPGYLERIEVLETRLREAREKRRRRVQGSP